MTLKSNAKFEEKLTFDLENNMRNLAIESVKVRILMGSSCPKWKMRELKTYRGLMCTDTEE